MRNITIGFPISARIAISQSSPLVHESRLWKNLASPETVFLVASARVFIENTASKVYFRLDYASLLEFKNCTTTEATL